MRRLIPLSSAQEGRGIRAYHQTVPLSSRTERLNAQRPADITRAAEILRSGGIVAFPTETVYGLGANALDPTAVEKIFVAKQRPHWDPLIVHIANPRMLAQVCDRNRNLSPTVAALMDRFWPGPLTLLLPRASGISDIVTAGRPLVGVRMPALSVALELIRQAGVPIAAPSANTFGHTSPTTAAHVLADLGGRIDAILDGGPTSVGLESTVIEPTNRGVRIYRPGAIDAELLGSVVDLAERYVPGPSSSLAPESLPSPGVGIRHYAPRAKLVLVSGLIDEEIVRSRKPLELIEQSLAPAIDQAFDGTETIGVMLPDGWNSSCAQLTYAWGPWRDGEILARRLFAGLRELDDAGATLILCPVPELPGIGEAIRDRLLKAARPR